MIPVSKLDHVVFRVRDLEPMVRFYEEVLGAVLERQLPETGLYQLRLGEFLIDLVPVESQLGRQGGMPPGSEDHNVDHICFQVEPWEEERLVSLLQSHGYDAKVEMRYGALGNGPSIYIDDPEGNTLELKGPPGKPVSP